MKLTRFPCLGVAGVRLALVVLAGGCSSLTNPPAVSHDGGPDAIVLVDGAGPAEAGPGFDGAGDDRTESGPILVVDAQLADGAAAVGDDAAAPIPRLDAPGDVSGPVGTRDGGSETRDAALALPDFGIPEDDSGAAQADVPVLVDVATGDDRSESPTDTRADGNVLLGDAADAAAAASPEVAGPALTVNAGNALTACAGWPVPIGLLASGGTPPYTYAWSSNPACLDCISNVAAGQPVVTVDATTKFSVTARDSLGAVASSSVTITIADVADAGPEGNVDPGASARIGTPARPGYTYAWTCDRPTCGLSSATAAQPTVNPILSTQYTVTVSSPAGCHPSDTTVVWVNLPVSTSPPDGAPAYPDSAALVVQFGASVLASSIKSDGGPADTLTLRETVSGTPVAFTYVYNPALQTLTITPTGANYNATVGQYTLTLIGGTSGIISDDATRPQRLPDNVVVHFTLAVVPNTTAPTIVYRSPAQGSTGAAPNTSVVVIFSEPIDPSTASLTVSTTGPGSANLAGALSYDPTTATLTFVPAATLGTFTTYTVRVSGIKDLAGNSASPPSWNFTTGRNDNTTIPTVTAVSPASAATRVAIGSSVSVTFSEPVAPATVVDGIQVAAGANLVAGSVTYDGPSQVATFTPSDLLASQTLYTVTVSGVTDLAGNSMTAPFSSTFTTARILFSDSFESGTAKWTWPQNSAWGLTTDQSVSPSHSLTDSPGGNYGPNVDTSAVSTVIDVTGVGSVSLGYWLSGQTQPQPGGDALRVDYSINGGVTWPNLANWSGTLDWAQHTLTIPPGPGSTFPPGTTGLQIRFRFTSNGSQQYDGVYIDDVIVQAP